MTAVAVRACDTCGEQATGYANDLQKDGTSDGWQKWRVRSPEQFCDKHSRDGRYYDDDGAVIEWEEIDA